MPVPTIQLSTYKTRVRNKLGDPAFDDASLTQFADETNKEICNQPVPWPFMETTFPGTLASGFTTFAFPSDLQAPVNVEITAPNANASFLTFMPYKQFDQLYPDPTALTPGAPSVWSRFGANWMVGPAPLDQTYTAQLRYIKVPTTISADTNTFDVPDDFSELVVLGMYARALEAADQPDYADAQYKRFERQLTLLIQRYGLGQTGQAQVMQNRRTLLRGR